MIWYPKKSDSRVVSPEITILCDNNSYDKRLRVSCGFSCLVSTGIEGSTVLFDTGNHSSTLLYNINLLGIDPKKINIIVCSHIDDDHIGGLFGFLKENHQVTVYVPTFFGKSFGERIVGFGAKCINVSLPTEITDGIYSTGEMGEWIKEQSLIINTPQGLVILVACGHPGILKVIKGARKVVRGEIFLVLGGGFRFNDLNDKEINKIVDEFQNMGIVKVAPCHSSSEKTTRLFKRVYQEGFIKTGVGKVIMVK